MNMESYYKQLSEDWRMRDRMTWQMPSYLVIIGGILLISLYSSQLGITGDVKCIILWIGLSFVWLIQFFLIRNIYLQAIAMKLLEKIVMDEMHINDVKRLALRVPLCPDDYRFRSIIKDLSITTTSLLLLGFCTAFIGVFALLLFGMNDSNIGTLTPFYIGFVFAFFNILVVVFVSRQLFNKPKKTCYRILGLITIFSYIILFVFILFIFRPI